MTAALLGLLLLASDPPPAADELPPVVEVPQDPALAPMDPPLWEVYLGAIGGMRPDALGGGGGFMLGVNRKFFNFIRPELMVASTVVTAPIDYLILIRIGARWELPNQTPWKPYLWTAFAHNHESAVEDVAKDPAGHLFGLSSSGVHHRSGLELGLGVAYEMPRFSKWRIATRFGARATFTQFFGDPYPPRYVDLTITAGVCL